MASSHSTHGTILANKVELSHSNSVKFVADSDATKSITLHLNGEPSAAGDVKYELPVITSAQTLLHNGSTLNGANLSAGSIATASLADDAVTADKIDIASATDIAGAMADADSLLVSDSDAGNAVKRITGSALKTYVGALPSGTDGQMIVYDVSNNAQAVSASGDVTLANTGAFTIANSAVENAMIADNAVNAAKIGAGQVTAPKLAVGCIDNANKFGAGVVDATALASNAVTTAKINNSAVTKAKIQDAPTTYGTQEASALMALDANKDSSGVRHFVAEGDLQAGASNAVRLGADADNSWRFVISGADLLIQKKETGSWVTKSTIVA